MIINATIFHHCGFDEDTCACCEGPHLYGTHFLEQRTKQIVDLRTVFKEWARKIEHGSKIRITIEEV